MLLVRGKSIYHKNVKLDTVILASNENPNYIDFWPVVSSAWLEMGVEPILVYTGNKKLHLEGNIINFKSHQLDSAFVAQNIRILFPGLLENKNCIVSDIDSLPLSKDYFVNSINKIPDDAFVIYRPDAGVPKNMISMMWNAANSSTWKEIFSIEAEKDIYKKLNRWYKNNYSFQGSGWYTDQIKLQKYLSKFSKKNSDRVIKLNDFETGFNRFNRNRIDEHLEKLLHQEETFTSFHMPRPYKENEELINLVLNKHKHLL